MSEHPRLKDLGRWLSGGTPPRDDLLAWEGDVPWISAKDIASTQLRAPTAFITRDAAVKHSKLVGSDSILIIVRGMALAHGLPIVLSHEEVAFNQDLRALVPRRGIDPRFVYYGLIGHRGRFAPHIDRAAHGTARVIDSIYSERIWLPGRRTQQRIADFLDGECERLNALEHKVRAAAAAVDEHVMAERHQHLCGEELERSLSVGSWPAGWPTLYRVVDRWFSGGTPDSSSPAFWTDDEQAPHWIAIGDMSGRRYVGVGSRRLTTNGISSARLHPAPTGTLLLAMYASVGEVAELTQEAYFNQALIGMYVADPLMRELIYEWITLIKPHLMWFTKSNTQANLTGEIVRHLPIPPLSRESASAALQAVRNASGVLDRTARVTTSMGSKLKEYRDALISEVVNGQLDISKLSTAELDERAYAALEGATA